MPWRSAAIPLAVLALVFGGCGGDDDSPPQTTRATATTESQTRQEFIARADALCARANKGIEPVNARIRQINQNATGVDQALVDAAPLLKQAYELQRDYAAKFRALAPPMGDEQTFDAIVSGIDRQVSIVGLLADAADAGDAAQLRQLTPRLAQARARVRGLLQGYGFKICGRA